MSVSQQQVITLLENVLFESATQAAANEAIWAANSASGSIASLASAMASSGEETIAATVVGYYLSALGRAPSAAEIRYYVGIAEQGLTPAQIAAGQVASSTWSTISDYFAHSPEFAARGGLDYSLGTIPALFEAVSWLYQSVLGRAPSGAELSYYDNQVAAGGSLTTLFREFTASPEFATDTSSQIQTALAAYGTDEASGLTPPPTIGGSVTLGPPPPPPAPSPAPAPTPSPYAFTTGTDTFTTTDGSLVYTAILGGASPTLTPNDSLHGAGNTLNITDTSGAASQDIIPTGVSLTDVATITLTTSGNAGTDDSHPFDLSGVTDLTSFTLTASGTQGDFIKVGTGVAVTVQTASATVDLTSGFASLALTDNSLTTLDLTGTAGAVTLTDPSGQTSLTINVSDLSLTGGITDSSHHVTSLTLTGTGTTSIDTITDSALTSLTVSGDVTLGSSGTPISLPSGLTTLSLSSDSGNVYLDVNSSGFTIALGSGANQLTDNQGGNAITAGNGDNTIVNAGTTGADSISVGNGNNTITDHSTSSGGTITVGTGYNTIDVASHDGSVLHLGPDGNYGTDDTTPNVVIENATAGVTIEFTGNPAIAQFLPESHTVADLPTLIHDLEADVLGSPRSIAEEGFGGNTYIVESETGILGPTDTVIVELVGAHNINVPAGQIVLSS